jgi:hypothetical protein
MRYRLRFDRLLVTGRVEDGNEVFLAGHAVGVQMGLTPPAADCNAETAGTVDDVRYTADYYFCKAKR